MPFLVMGLLSKAVGLQSFERCCRRLFERDIQLLHRRQRFTQFAAHLRGRLPQRVQHFFLGWRRHLLLGQRVSANAIHGL